MMKRIVSLLLAAALAFALAAPALAEESGFRNFRKTAEYTDGVFSDVRASDWYGESVRAVYELGLMQGNGDGTFNAAGNVTIAETLVLAGKLHRIFTEGSADFVSSDPWYQVYADYAAENGLLPAPLQSRNVRETATRAEFVAMLARALPESALPALNDVADGAVPDVPTTADYAAEIYGFYRAGILAGNDEYGRFAPDTPIERSAVAAVVARLAYRSLRLRFVLEELKYPDLAERPAVQDEFFSNSALLGNSLAQGMKLYSGLKHMSFFAYQSTSVFDPNGYSPDRCFDKLLQGQYERVYIEYGINEIHRDPADICAAYGGIIDRIREAMPGVEIYVMAVTPTTYAVSSRGSFSMTKIRTLNAALHDMCAEKECWYLDCCELLCDETGYLPDALKGWDGSPHLAVKGYQVWADIIRTHYAD